MSPDTANAAGDAAVGVCVGGLALALQDCGLSPEGALLVAVLGSAAGRVLAQEVRAWLARRPPPPPPPPAVLA